MFALAGIISLTVLGLMTRTNKKSYNRDLFGRFAKQNKKVVWIGDVRRKAGLHPYYG